MGNGKRDGTSRCWGACVNKKGLEGYVDRISGTSISELQKITLMGTTEFFNRVNSLEPKVPGLDSVLHRLNKRAKNDNNYNNNNM